MSSGPPGGSPPLQGTRAVSRRPPAAGSGGGMWEHSLGPPGPSEFGPTQPAAPLKPWLPTVSQWKASSRPITRQHNPNPMPQAPPPRPQSTCCRSNRVASTSQEACGQFPWGLGPERTPCPRQSLNLTFRGPACLFSFIENTTIHSS